MKPFDINKAVTIQLLSEDNEVVASYHTKSVEDSGGYSIALFMTNQEHTGVLSNTNLLDLLNVYGALLELLEQRGIEKDMLDILTKLAHKRDEASPFNEFMKRMMDS